MNLHNTLTRSVEVFSPLSSGGSVRMYSCGPTVYDHVHIGNLSAFITADVLRRALQAWNYEVKHVMNYTDVDDKTINRSRSQFPDMSPEEALHKLTRTYEKIFLSDMQAIGNDIEAVDFVRATDSMEAMRNLIAELYKHGYAYIAEDGVYFSIEKYRKNGGRYGQLLKLTTDNTSAARINNDEYDKNSVHDFALWKIRKADEPAWEFHLDGHELIGRPGWHIECSTMSAGSLGQPFDIHTGGVDLIFPHHENEIAQSTAGKESPIYARFFVHNEHVLVNGKKMSKSLGNFYTLRDIVERGFDPLAFRMLVLQSHYRSQINFSWESLEAAQNRLKNLRAVADLRWQNVESAAGNHDKLVTLMTEDIPAGLLDALNNDLNTAQALAVLSEHESEILDNYTGNDRELLNNLLQQIDDLLGLQLLTSEDITKEQKDILNKRGRARQAKKWDDSDKLRDLLAQEGIGIRDTSYGQIWFRT